MRLARWTTRPLALASTVAFLIACGEAQPAQPLPQPPNLPADFPPPPRLRRLTRDEVNLTLRDLLGDYTSPANILPDDPVGYLYDNLAEAQSLVPLHVQAMVDLAEDVVARSWQRRAQLPRPYQLTLRALPTPLEPTAPPGTFWISESGNPVLDLGDAEPGVVRLRGRVRTLDAVAGPIELRVYQDGLLIGGQRLEFAAGTPGATLELELLPEWSGTTAPQLMFEARTVPGGMTPRLAFDSITAEGPMLRDEQRIGTCDAPATGEEPCARQELTALARRAWRRPVADAELDRLLDLYRGRRADGDAHEAALQFALAAVIAAPHMLFRFEAPPTDAAPGSRTPVDPWALATRLSYLLWGSMPDRALFDAASAGRLTAPEDVAAQTRRMVDDPRFNGFVRRFGGSWLGFGGVQGRAAEAFSPNFSLPRSAYRESMATFAEAARGNATVADLLGAESTWVDGQLARIYGVSQQTVPWFFRASLRGTQRRGYLTQAGFLMMFDRSTVRGMAVLTRLLCSTPPPPPTNNFAMFSMRFEQRPFRQRLEAHRQSPQCAGCHAVLDPVGFAFDNFDNFGEWRTEEFGQRLDVSGSLNGLGRFDGALEFIELLRRDDRLTPCAAENLLRFATGRSAVPASDVTAITGRGEGLRDLLVAMVTSEAFRAYEVDP